MRIFFEPTNFDKQPFKEKVIFILKCYERREAKQKQYGEKFFGQTSDYIRPLFEGVRQRLDNYLNRRLWYNFLTEADIKMAFDLVSQAFLSNDEFFSYAEELLQNKNLSWGFKKDVNKVFFTARLNWKNFSTKIGSLDENSASIRTKIKAGALGVSCLSVSCCGFGWFSLVSTAAAATAYAISGECGDSLALASSPENPEKNKARAPGYMRMMK